jgi:hypothetical protein
MSASTNVLKCREYGMIRSAGYEADGHSRIDGCDGRLDSYCNDCRNFFIGDMCTQCAQSALEAERRHTLERKAGIERLLAAPGVLFACSLLRRWPWFHALSNDFIDRAGLTVRSKYELSIAAGFTAVRMSAPAWMRAPLWALIATTTLLVCTTPTIASNAPTAN